ncbi:hypothetical protein M9Y10_030985 [Tritrichomonas musculus]|uniref:Protein kinase domain-containing protein n=1 Tax=Tritrichomonas musculus TaxID=1915356 RepID=A0ABR2H1H6_9EUKA
MESSFLQLENSLKNDEIKFRNSRINDIIKLYSFIQVSDDSNYEMKQEIYQNMKDSKTIMINYYYEKEKEDSNDRYFIIGFERTIISIKQTCSNFIQILLSKNPEPKICFLRDTKNFFHVEIPYKEIVPDSFFMNEICSFSHQLISEKNYELFQNIFSCVTGYLIQKAYHKINANRIDFFVTNSETKKYDIKEFINLRQIDASFSSKVELYYHFESEQLFAIKTYFPFNEKLLEREIGVYNDISHPLIPKYYGIIEGINQTSIIIEYINGQTLQNIKDIKLNEEQKIMAIFDLLCIFLYLHEKNYVYRDLKPNNVIVDENNQIVLIDFGGMINIKEQNEEDNCFTKSFNDKYAAPENIHEEGIPSFKSDIYSLGKMIYFILMEDLPNNENENFNIYQEIFIKKWKIHQNCLHYNPDLRPSIHELIKNFLIVLFNENHFDSSIIEKINQKYHCYSLKYEMKSLQEQLYYIHLILAKHFTLIDMSKAIYYFTLANGQNDPQTLFIFGTMYFEGKYVQRDIQKAMNYYILAADKNHVQSQIIVGLYYFENVYVKRNMNKVIHYFTLAANQNDQEAQYYLGLIYFEGTYVQQNVDKAIYYFELASNQNNIEAQFNLGFIYEDDKYCRADINKAIYYYSLAANQNHPKAQLNLGIIYFEGKFVQPDINKAIYLFELASKQNISEAQLRLGLIYSKGENVDKDINKAIYYFELASRQDVPEAFLNLALIYAKGEQVEQDMKKFLHYLTLASKLNNSEVYFTIGLIYAEGTYVQQDMNKAIHYFELAANQKHPQALFNLGLFYFKGQYVQQDISRAIHYYTESAKQNYANAQYNLAILYSEGRYVQKDSTKAIHYYSLAADQNMPEAQLNLGIIYEEGKYVPRNIKKAIHYYSLAANQNIPEAQFILGNIYFEGKDVLRDINRAIFYYTLSGDQNHSEALFNLGCIYYVGKFVSRDLDKAKKYFTRASYQNHPKAMYAIGMMHFSDITNTEYIREGIKYLTKSCFNGFKQACFSVGFLFHEGKYMKKNIQRSIHFYKEASSFNNQFAKNNLGIIYKNGFNDEIKQNLGLACAYFEEAIKQKNDKLSKYNLAHIYLYNEITDHSIDKSIDLLIQSSLEGFNQSLILLCISLIKKYGYNFDAFAKRLDNDSLSLKIIRLIELKRLNNEKNYEQLFKQYRHVDFLYNIIQEYVLSSKISEDNPIENIQNNSKIIDISEMFYEGFGFGRI